MKPHHAFRSNKFYPPRVDDSQLLLREQLITNKLPGKHRGKKIIVVEAQAGQGKTTLLYQYVTYTDRLYCWHRIDAKDSDPVLFLTALYLNLKNIIPGFESPEFSRIFGEGAVDVYNLTSYVNILLSDIDRHMKNELYLVFDDLHLIDAAESTNGLLDYIIETSPPKIQFILSSRHPLQLNNKTLRNKRDVLTLKTADLSLDATEIENLFENVFNQTINLKDATTIQDRTDGWIMGIVLTALESSSGTQKAKRNSDSFSFAVSQEALSNYFHNETFSHIFQDLHKPLFKLSLLNELPIDLAVRIIDIDDLGQKLDYFTRSNYFIYKLDEDRQTFCFHHLFQEYLQNEARKQLHPDEIRNVYSLAADYYLEQQNVYETLTCYFNAGEFDKMDNLLHKEGIGLLAQNLNITILSLLNQIPEETLAQYGWLSLFAGILGETTAPQKTLPLLEAARQTFILKENEVGELLALAQSIYYHFVVSGLYREGARLLERTEELFINNAEALTPLENILATRNLAAGFCFFNCDMAKAKHYGVVARNLATKLSIVNFIASSRFVLGYIALFSGNRAACLREAEYLYTLLPDPIIGMQNKLSLIFMHLDDLTKHGDYANFFQQVELFKSKVDESLIKQTIAAPYILIYQCLMHISSGEIEKALVAINQAPTVSQTAKTAHMSSQILQWRAYIHAILGNMDDAESDIREASKSREIAGGHFHTSMHFMIKGAIYVALGRMQEAKESFNQAIELARAIPSPYMVSAILLHRSFMYIKQQDKNQALKDLKNGLKLMRENGYTYFWSWEPALMTTLLSTAVINDIEKTFCRELAKKRLNINIDDDGTIIPMLRFTMLDGFTIRHKGDILFSSKELSEKQRELLDLLLTKKHQQVKLNEVQATLWLDEDPEKTRTNFDALHARLRKTLTSKLQVPVKHYLVIKRSILYLNNCTIDTEDFLILSNKGIVHAQNGQYWQAGNYFHTAIMLWQGHLPEDTFHSNDAITYSLRVENRLIEVVITWGTILANSGLLTESIELLEKLIEKFRQNDILVTYLYELYRKNNSLLKANELLKRYRAELDRNDYPEEEIDENIADVISKYEKSLPN